LLLYTKNRPIKSDGLRFAVIFLDILIPKNHGKNYYANCDDEANGAHHSADAIFFFLLC